MLKRLAAIAVACVVALLLLPCAAATAAPARAVPAQPALLATKDNGGANIFGTVNSPSGKPLKGVTITVTKDGTQVGKDTTDKDGKWKVPVPGSGKYTVTLDVSTLPKNLHPRQKGGQKLTGVALTKGESQPVIFSLSSKKTPQESKGSETTETSGPQSGPTGPKTSGGEEGSGFGARFIQLFIGGIEYGAIIAITAVGLSLVFGTTRLINFAHGEMVMIGAVVAYIVSTGALSLPLILAAVIAMIAVGALGAGFEYTLWRPLRRRGAGLIQMFIISIGLSLFLRHLVLAFFGGRRAQYSQYAVQESLHFGPIAITPRDLTITLISLGILLIVAVALQRTMIGKATRAVADNRDLAEASGIDVNRVILVVWVSGGALAGLGGVFFGLSEAVYWNMGFNLLLLMFAGIIVGGLGSAYGAIIGSLLVGLVAQLSTLWFSPELQNAWALFALIVVLLFRPQGILGRAERAG